MAFRKGQRVELFRESKDESWEDYMREYIGCHGVTVTLDTFGASGPVKDLAKRFGFTTENVLAKAQELLAR